MKNVMKFYHFMEFHEIRFRHDSLTQKVEVKAYLPP
jgi:hypothetical protein